MVAVRGKALSEPVASHGSTFFGTFGSTRAVKPLNYHTPQTAAYTSAVRKEEGLYITSVEYLSEDALHAMRLRNGSVVTFVDFSEEDQAWIASDESTMEFGVGDSWSEAIQDYVENLHSMAFWFRQNDRPIGPHLKKQLQTFQLLFVGL